MIRIVTLADCELYEALISLFVIRLTVQQFDTEPNWTRRALEEKETDRRWQI